MPRAWPIKKHFGLERGPTREPGHVYQWFRLRVEAAFHPHISVVRKTAEQGTGASSSLAAQYLRLAENHTKQVIALYLAYENAELEPPGPPQSSRPTPLPPASTRPPRYRKGYEDGQGVVYFGSDQEGTNYSDSDEVYLPKPAQDL